MQSTTVSTTKQYTQLPREKFSPFIQNGCKMANFLLSPVMITLPPLDNVIWTYELQIHLTKHSENTFCWQESLILPDVAPQTPGKRFPHGGCANTFHIKFALTTALSHKKFVQNKNHFISDYIGKRERKSEVPKQAQVRRVVHGQLSLQWLQKQYNFFYNGQLED